DPVLEAKLVKRTALPPQLLTHHDKRPVAAKPATRNHVTKLSSTEVLQQPLLEADIKVGAV
ncbi:MAG: hypothetical protein VB959_10500, partial [Rhodospirillales bacterium]